MAKKSVLNVVPDQPSTTLATVADVESAVAKIARLDRERTRLEAEYNERKATLDAEFTPRIDPLLEQRKALESQVIEYAQEHRAEIKGKTWALRFADVVFSRAAERVELLRPMAEIVAALKRAKLASLVRVEEFVDKKDLKALAPKYRETVGFDVIPSKETAKLVIDYQRFQLNELSTVNS